MMLAMMNVHGLRINVRLERLGRVGQRRKNVGHDNDSFCMT
jgi:hypothetical protein